jgi:hypothetical protein
METTGETKTRCKVSGLGDPFLERILGVALEAHLKEFRRLDDEVLGLLFSVIKVSGMNPDRKKATVGLMQGIVRSLKEAGW